MTTDRVCERSSLSSMESVFPPPSLHRNDDDVLNDPPPTGNLTFTSSTSLLAVYRNAVFQPAPQNQLHHHAVHEEEEDEDLAASASSTAADILGEALQLSDVMSSRSTSKPDERKHHDTSSFRKQ